jgi:outer membrane protein
MKLLKIAIFLISISAFAQGKVGAVDVEYIISKMPEMESVKAQVETYGNKMDLDLNKKIDEYKKLAEAYKTDEATFTLEQKRQKQSELITLDADITKFQQNGMKLLEIKQNETLIPLYKKMGEALEKVALAQGYTQVIKTNQDLVYLDPNFDLTDAILTELGITITDGAEGK